MMGTDNTINNTQINCARLLLDRLVHIEERKNDVLGLTKDRCLVYKTEFASQTKGLKKTETFDDCQKRLTQYLEAAMGKKILGDRGIKSVATQKSIINNLKSTLFLSELQKERTLPADLEDLYEHRHLIPSLQDDKLTAAALVAETLKVEEERTLTEQLESAIWEEGTQPGPKEIQGLQKTVLVAARYPELSKIQQLTSGTDISRQNVNDALTALHKLPPDTPAAFIMQAAHTTFYRCHQNKDQQQQAKFRQIVQTWPEDLQSKFKAHWKDSGLEGRYSFTPPAKVPEKVTESLPRSQKQAENAKPTPAEHKTEVSAEEQKQSEKTKTAEKTEQVPPSGNKAEALPQSDTTEADDKAAAELQALIASDTPVASHKIPRLRTSSSINAEKCAVTNRKRPEGSSQSLSPEDQEKIEQINKYGYANFGNPNVLEELLLESTESMSEALRKETAEVSLTSLRDDLELPFDSNLLCPVCKKTFRIGQIQRYRGHVDKCQST